MWPGALLATRRLVGVAREVDMRNALCTGQVTDKRGSHPGFETHDRCHQKSKTGVSVAHKKYTCSPKKFKKKTGTTSRTMNYLSNICVPSCCQEIVFWHNSYQQQSCSMVQLINKEKGILKVFTITIWRLSSPTSWILTSSFSWTRRSKREPTMTYICCHTSRQVTSILITRCAVIYRPSYWWGWQRRSRSWNTLKYN